jgi:hypothetical protein
MFGYRPSLLPNPHLAELERDVTTIDEARKKTGATIGHPGCGLIYHVRRPAWIATVKAMWLKPALRSTVRR